MKEDASPQSKQIEGTYKVTFETIESEVPVEEQKTLIFMHGAAETALDYVSKFKDGKLVKNKNVKIMLLQSHLKQGEKNPWMRVLKKGQNMDPDARNLKDGEAHCEAIVKLINQEIMETYGFLPFDEGAKRVFLAGKSQGALLSIYIQLMKLPFSLGGTAAFAGYPLKPLLKMADNDVSPEEAQSRCLNLARDMRFFIWHGTKDEFFEHNQTFDLYTKIFTKLGISETVKVMDREEGLGHETSPKGMLALMEFMG